MTPLERFMAKVDKTETCWLWTGCIVHTGYGRFSYEGKPRNAHRVAYELLVGPIPEGLHLDHLCRVRHCVNPEHLEPVTIRENSRRGQAPAWVTNRENVCQRGHSMADAYTVKSGPQAGRRNCRVCQLQRWAKAQENPEHRAKHAERERQRKARQQREAS